MGRLSETILSSPFVLSASSRVAMSPTGLAKMTPPAMTSALHRWESAEVITVEEPLPVHLVESKNPFSDQAAVEDRRKSGANPFFGAQHIPRSTSRARSRSNSVTSAGRHSRSASRVSRTSTVTRARTMSSAGVSTSDQTQVAVDPFSDEASAGIPKLKTHAPSDSTSSNPLGNDHAMKSLIAALNLTQEEVEERLRVARYSGVSGISGMTEDADDAATIRDFPKPPST